MQLNNSYRNIAECTREVYKAEGLKAFYISYPVTLLMSMPFQVIQFTTYEYSLKKLNPSGEYNPLAHCMAGATAGAVASSLTNPLDVAKTLLQTRGLQTDNAVRHISGLKNTFLLIYQREGFLGFSLGLKARVLCHVPSTAVSWTTYEFLKMVFSS
jgi:solute carrier family 25 (mitochondrial iron transporter), member 28/37